MRPGLLTGILGLAIGIAISRLPARDWLPWADAPPLRWLPVAVVAAILAVIAGRLDEAAFVAAMTVVTAALVAVGIVNHAHPGARMLTAGVVANGLVVIANAGMPVDAAAVTAAGGNALTLSTSGRHHLLTDTSALPWLADTLGVEWLQVVVSPGDMLLAAGGVVLIATTLRGTMQHERARRVAAEGGAARSRRAGAPELPDQESLQATGTPFPPGTD